jgi:ankyrin repeat protein
MSAKRPVGGIVNFKSLYRRSALMLAVLAVSFFVEAKAEPKPPLYDPIQTGEVGQVREALQNGADVNATYKGETMLTRAIREKNDEVTKLLLAAPGIDVNKRGTYSNDMGSWTRTPLILAAGLGKAEIVSILLKKGAAVNAKDASDNTPESRGSTALIRAAQGDWADVIRVLINEAKGLDVNARSRDGKPAIWFVAEAEDLASVKLLREHGALANVANNEGLPIIATTYLHKRYEVIDYLVSQGADINRIDNRGLTPLDDTILMLKSDNRRTVYAFIEHFLAFKPNIDLQKSLPGGNGGEAALHLAVQFGHADMVGLLLDHGANVNLKNLTRGATPLHIAVDADKPEVAKVLIAHKANLEATDINGGTPLAIATYLRRSEMVKVLTDAGANSAAKSAFYTRPTASSFQAVTTAGPAVAVDKLYGTWTGSQDGIPYAAMTLTLNKNGSYSFTSKFTTAALKTYPKGTPPVIAAHQGSYTVNGDVLSLTPTSAAPTSMHLVLEGGVLILDAKTRMKRSK